MYQAAGHVNQVQHHRPNPAAFDFSKPGAGQMSLVKLKTLLADDANQVIGQKTQMQNQVIALKTTAGKTLKVHIGFYFRMKLLACPMIMIKGNDFFGG